MTNPKNLRLGMMFLMASIIFDRSSAIADGYENVPAGSRTAAMGGAGIAAGWDSAMPLLNPAGLALIPNSVASLSASLYQTSLVSIEKYVADGSTIPSRWGDLRVSEPGVESVEFGSFPSGLAYFYHLGSSDLPMTLAASLSVPRHINRRFILNTEFSGDSQGQAFGVSISDNITTIVLEEQYVAALSWAMALKNLRIGASLLTSYTTYARSSDRSQLTALGTANFLRELLKEATFIDSFDVGAIAGVQYRVTDWLGLGLSVRTPSFHIHGTLEQSTDYTRIESGAEPLVMVDQLLGKPETARGFPLKIGAGFTIEGDSWSLAVDGQYFRPRQNEIRLVGTSINSSIGGQDANTDRTSEIDASPKRVNVFNFALGFEYALTDSNWLRAGVFSEGTAEEQADVSIKTQPRVSPEFLFTFPIDRYGASLGLGTKLGPIDTTIGVRTTFGKGGTPRYAPEKIFFSNNERFLDTTQATVVDTVIFISAAVDVSVEAQKVKIRSTPAEGTPVEISIEREAPGEGKSSSKAEEKAPTEIPSDATKGDQL